MNWRKLLTRVGIGVAGFLLLLLAAGWILTAVYGESIKQKVLAEANRRLNATLSFDRVELTFFRHFPAPTVSLTELSLVGQGRFQGDTLVAFDRIDAGVNLFSLFGPAIEVTRLDVDRLKVRALVLADGAANWDIVKPDTAAPDSAAPADTGSAFRLRLSRYAVSRGSIRYRDQTFPMDLRLEGVNHTGRGDLTATVIDLRTENAIDHLALSYAGTDYLTGQRVTGRVGLRMDLSTMTFTLIDNAIKLNELPLRAEGSIQLRDNDMPLDLKLGLEKSDLKGLLSLVPALYKNQFDQLQAEGTVALQATVKGAYSETTLPGFSLGLQVQEGSFGYSSLPERVQHLNVDLGIDNPSGVIDRTVVDLRRLHAEVAGQVIDARIKVAGLKRPQLEGAVKGKLDLASIEKFYPLPDYELAGVLEADATFAGVLDSTRWPTAKGLVVLTNGRIAAKQLPQPLEAMNARLSLDNPTADGQQLTLRLEPFSLSLAQQPLSGRVQIKGLVDPAYDIALKGTLDLAVIDTLFPEAGRTLAGILKADLATTGRVSDVQKKRYDRLTGSGFVSLEQFAFESPASPVPVRIAAARGELSPQALRLTQFDATLGRSDLRLEGGLYELVPYLLGKGDLRGTLTAQSRLLDLNEFMAEGGASTSTTDSSAKLEAPMLPKGVDLYFQAEAGEVRFSRLEMKEFKGLVTLKDQVLRIVDCRFGAAGGTFVANAAYDTRTPERPHTTLAVKVAQLDIAQAVAAMPLIEQLAPVARYTRGLLNTDLNLSTDLRPDLMPDLGTLSMSGAFEALQAAVRGFPVTQALASTGKLSFLDNLAIERAAFSAQIRDGRVQVQPFSFPIQAGSERSTVTVSGSSGLDQSLDYRVGVAVPPALGGAAVQGLLSQVTGSAPGEVTLNFGVGGTAMRPVIRPLAPSLAAGGATTGSGAVKTAVKDAATQAVAPIKKQAEDSLAKAKAAAEAQLKAEQERLRQEAEKAKLEAERRAKDELERKKKEAADKLKKLNPFGGGN